MGTRAEPRRKGGCIDGNDIRPPPTPGRDAPPRNGASDAHNAFPGTEAVAIYPANTRSDIHFRRDGKVEFVQYPRVQANEQMGIVSSPDISRSLTRDLYTYVSVEMPGEARNDWSETEEVRVKIDEPFFVNDYVSTLEGIQRVD